MMKCKVRVGLVAVSLLFTLTQANAQRKWNNIYSKEDISRDSITQKGITLIFVNKQKGFPESLQREMKQTFFKIYPLELKGYNPDALKKVAMIIDPDYKGVAATAGGVIRVSPDWMEKNPEDLDVVTHEAMHIVQAYPRGSGPGWITEGIADFVRYKLGINNKAAHWALPNYDNSQKYSNAYRVTARFFVWLSKHYDQAFVSKLDAVMRADAYTPEFWKQQTGKTVDELWANYSMHPEI